MESGNPRVPVRCATRTIAIEIARRPSNDGIRTGTDDDHRVDAVIAARAVQYPSPISCGDLRTNSGAQNARRRLARNRNAQKSQAVTSAVSEGVVRLLRH